MHPALRRCRDGLRLALQNVSSEEAEISANGKWSVAKIVEHLDLTYARSAEGLARRLEKGVPMAPKPLTLRQRIGRLLVLRLGAVLYPGGRAAPTSVVPQGRRFVEVSVVIEPHLLVLDQRLKDVARAFGSRTPVLNHPFLGPCSVADWRRFHWAHTRHHLRQVRSKKSEVRGTTVHKDTPSAPKTPIK